MGMSVGEFVGMRPADFFLKLHYYNEARQREETIATELARHQTALILSALGNKTDIRRIWPTDYDKQDLPTITSDEFEKLKNLPDNF